MQKIIFTALLISVSITTIARPVSFKDCNKISTPLQCQYIKSTGKQCLNKSAKNSQYCKHHKKTNNEDQTKGR